MYTFFFKSRVCKRRKVYNFLIQHWYPWEEMDARIHMNIQISWCLFVLVSMFQIATLNNWELSYTGWNKNTGWSFQGGPHTKARKESPYQHNEWKRIRKTGSTMLTKKPGINPYACSKRPGCSVNRTIEEHVHSYWGK